ncbi:MAG TPA: hypothetical protein VIM73_14845 [Polyangiaceae bacterium]
MLFLPACADTANSAGAGEDERFVPEGLSVVPSSVGGNGVFNLIAFTLQPGSSRTDLYAALRNDGDIPACSPAFSVEFFDTSDQSIARGVAGLLVQRFYRTADDPEQLAACVGPGDVTMLAITDLPADLLEHVSHGAYWMTYWALNVVPTDGIAIREVQPVRQDEGTAYTGVLVNGLDVGARAAVAVFPVNRVGRPLGIASARDTLEVPPAGRWEFQTDTVIDSGAAHFAYPAGG